MVRLSGNHKGSEIIRVSEGRLLLGKEVRKFHIVEARSHYEPRIACSIRAPRKSRDGSPYRRMVLVRNGLKPILFVHQRHRVFVWSVKKAHFTLFFDSAL
eukprot:XP_001709480.1 Hypothetical protein GL50803_32099 [Giardia lamblia ATCC 50803]